jgi:hypothetical protein
MRTYRVTIRATVTKTLTVKAENEDDAYVAAHEDFSVLNTGKNEDERYEEETLEVKEVKP